MYPAPFTTSTMGLGMIPGALDHWRLFNEARLNVPAYRRFLQSQARANPESVARDRKSWTSIPVMDKKSYLQSYPLPELFPHERIGQLGHASSGSSGKPTFWFRGQNKELSGRPFIAGLSVMHSMWARRRELS
jgi:phenylacetate-coenzyme A ligase PaaK-like adenylate-forming protein